MSGIVLGSNTITINGKIMETGKFTFIQEPTSLVSATPIEGTDYKYLAFPFVFSFEYDSERMYPPIRNLTSNSHTVSGQSYGNGLYVCNQSSTNDNVRLAFSAFNTSINSGPHYVENNYTSAGVYNKALFIVSGYIGEWLKIKMPVSIQLSKYGFLQRDDVNGPTRSPKDFKIYGSNDDTNWIEIEHETNATYSSLNFEKSISVNNTYNHFALVVNKLSSTSGTTLNFDEWFIYGKVVIPNNQISYSVTFSENTEVQLLLLDSTKYIQAVPFNISNSSLELIVGKNGSFSSFSGVSTGTNGITYGSGFVSNITGGNITYNSPIVILRYKYANYGSQWTYSASNPNVYHLGNVGIGTTNPTSALHVLGSFQVNGSINASTLSATTKNFKIEHPLNINKWLYHGCVESPRFDNIYRGKKIIINGKGEVDIDEECNTTGGMTKGTFVSLNTNFSLYLQNKKTYDRIKGSITDGKISINCQNIEDIIEVDWLVMGERYDNTVITNELTNYEGKLICEHDKDQ
jgi:hypothetical protein